MGACIIGCIRAWELGLDQIENDYKSIEISNPPYPYIYMYLPNMSLLYTHDALIL